MGNSPSLYDDNDWTKANGGLTKAFQTVDGAEPTTKHTVVTITPRVALPGRQLPVVGNLLVAREYEIRDDKGDILYTTKIAAKLRQGFDLVDQDQVVLRVDATFNNRSWQIYQVGTPVFEGQRPDPSPSEVCGENLFRKASVVFGKDVEHEAVVHMFSPTDDTVDTILKVERCNHVAQKWHFQSMLANNIEQTEKQPLVGYWKWEGSAIKSAIPLCADDKMSMDLAKGSDVGLHVILAILATLERSSVKAEYSG